MGLKTGKTPSLHRKPKNRTKWISHFLVHGPHCHYCDVRLTLDTAHQEHMTPLCRGGEDSWDNIVPACGECNQMKAWRTADEFLRDREFLLSQRTGKRATASLENLPIAAEEKNEPGLLKKLKAESERISWAWRNPA